MADYTLEQKRALAVASARLRLQQAEQGQDEAVPEYISDMTGTQKFNAGMGKAVADMGRGLTQLVRDTGLTPAGPLLKAAGYDLGGQMADTLGLPTNADIDEARKRDQALMNTGAGMGGNITGHVLSLVPTAFVPGANTYKGAAAIGALSGALRPTEGGSQTERLANVAEGAILAPATLAAFRGAGHLYRGAKAAIAPATEAGQSEIVGNLLNRTAGDNASQVRQALQNAREIIPGSQPTAAEVSNSGGIAAMQRALAQSHPEAYAARGVEQNAARLSALRGIAGTDAELAAAKAARESAAEPLYTAARKAGVDQQVARAIKPQIDNLMERMPRGVLERAKELARINGEAFDSAGSVTGLHYVKKAVDDLLSQTGESGVGKITRGALQVFQKDLLSTIDELSPLYAQGRQAFASGSVPINQMQVGRTLLGKLEPALSEGQVPVRINAETFARALRSGDQLAQKATGFKGATLTGTMTPRQLQTLEALREDMARSAMATNLGRGAGSNTYQNLAQQNLINEAGLSSAPQLLSRPVAIANYLLRSVYGSANKEMEQKLAQALLNPQEAARLMQAANPSEARRAIAEALFKAGRFAPAVGALPVASK